MDPRGVNHAQEAIDNILKEHGIYSFVLAARLCKVVEYFADREQRNQEAA